MRKRSKRLAGLPSEHAYQGGLATVHMNVESRKALKAAQIGDCKTAYNHLTNASELFGVAGTHAAESEKKTHVDGGTVDVYRDAHAAFRRECLRKPGLLDRFRKKRS